MVVLRRNGRAEGPRHAGEAERALGEPVLVQRDETQHLAHAQGHDGEVILLGDAQRDERDQAADCRHDCHRAQGGDEGVGARLQHQQCRRVRAERIEAGEAEVDHPTEAPLEIQRERQDGREADDDPEQDEERDHFCGIVITADGPLPPITWIAYAASASVAMSIFDFIVISLCKVGRRALADERRGSPRSREAESRCGSWAR